MKINIVSLYDNKRWDQYPTKQSLHALRLGAYVRKHRPDYKVTLSAYEMSESDENIAKRIFVKRVIKLMCPQPGWECWISSTN